MAKGKKAKPGWLARLFSFITFWGLTVLRLPSDSFDFQFHSHLF